MPNDNNLTLRPFADVEERLDDTTRIARENKTRREVDYRAIADLLSSEIYNLIATTDDPKVKQWGRNLLSKLQGRINPLDF
jgi:hypothetical protein